MRQVALKTVPRKSLTDILRYKLTVRGTNEFEKNMALCRDSDKI